jgi:hypothetical protein
MDEKKNQLSSKYQFWFDPHRDKIHGLGKHVDDYITDVVTFIRKKKDFFCTYM